MAQATAETPFYKLFQQKLDDIERRALHAGTNLTAVCKKIGISRSTPDRWRRAPPRTIEILEKMDRCVTHAEKIRAAKA